MKTQPHVVLVKISPSSFGLLDGDVLDGDCSLWVPLQVEDAVPSPRMGKP
jgi:hypothetical protein